jgi:hypothetical protein
MLLNYQLKPYIAAVNAMNANASSIDIKKCLHAVTKLESSVDQNDAPLETATEQASSKSCALRKPD